MKLPSTPPRRKKTSNTPYVMGGMLGLLAFLILGVFSLSLVDTYLLRSTSLAAVISATLVDLTNTDRGVDNLGGLTVSPLLTAAAQAKANDMATKGYFAHVSPDGLNSWYWFKQAGYTFIYAGENLAVDFSDSADVETAWMNSPTHRANILDGNFTQIGIATAQGTYQGHPTTFVVQMFGTPSPTSAPVATVRTITSPTEPTAPALATTKAVAAVAVAPKAVATTVARVLGTQADSILPPPPASWWQHLLASPKTMLQYAYYGLAGAILVLLAFVTELEFHRRHMRHLVAVAILFALMAGLFVLADVTFFSTPVIAAFSAT
jgi:uncharacterized protein YkwD